MNEFAKFKMPLGLRYFFIIVISVSSIYICFTPYGFFGIIIMLFAVGLSNRKVNYIGPKQTELNNTKWEPVQEASITKAKEIYAKNNQIAKDFSKKRINPWLGAIIILIGCVIYIITDDFGFIYCGISIYLLFYGLFCTGGIKMVQPDKLMSAILQQEEINVSGDWTVERSMEVAKGVNFPVNLKTTLKYNKAPKEFIGIQVQTTRNNVNGSYYNYTYCVIIAKKEYNLIDKYNKANINIVGNIVIEDSSDKNSDVDVIVVRFNNYVTSDKDVKFIINTSVEIVETL